MVNDQKSVSAAKQLFCIDSFGIGKDSGVVVCVFNDESSVRNYCRQTGLEMREGMRRMEIANQSIRR